MYIHMYMFACVYTCTCMCVRCICVYVTYYVCVFDSDSPYKKGPRLSFFPPLVTFEPPYPIAPDGVLPNSALLQVPPRTRTHAHTHAHTHTCTHTHTHTCVHLHPLQLLRKSEADQAMADSWAPPVLSDQQKKLMAEMDEQVHARTRTQ